MPSTPAGELLPGPAALFSGPSGRPRRRRSRGGPTMRRLASPRTRPSAVQVSPESFIKCLKKFYHHWKEDESNLWGSSSAIAIATPPPSDDIRYQESLALSMWFFGRELPETVMVFMERQIHVLCKQKGCDVLKPLKVPVSKAVSIDIVLHNSAKGDNGSSLMDEIFRAVCSHSESKSVVIGHLAREKPEGKVLEAWSEKLNGSRLRLSDMSSGMSNLLAVKDATEIMYVKKAAYLTASVMRKYIVPELEKIIADERKVPHSKLTGLTEKIFLSPTKVDVS
ncbi:hypothetical protein E2562_014723 [Oryza meyeriana var. granulata]|uniref:FACT complex subunit n=1 Tax=Oryza meyeriana var. granulata TaxID=110450 RepID=A0A6G1BKQ6_9ORYZ|nr:hypothetical protein E2562_014723 [Oryza meyeriana var. granulata]